MRCFIDPADWEKPEVELDRAETHHLARVLRVRVGAQVAVFNGRGGVGLAVVRELGSRAVLALVERALREPPAPALVLIQAVLREQKMDWIIQKAVELGASRIMPVETGRAVARVTPERATGKAGRWMAIALNAAKQSGNPWLPEILPAMSLAQAVASARAELLLVGSLASEARPLRAALESVADRPVATVAVAIGPEGDFTAAEHALLTAAGAVPVTFGGDVLRAETAALYALSVLRYHFRP